MGVDEPPGVQNFSSWPSRTPPASSSRLRNVVPSGASNCPGLVTCPETEYNVMPLLFSVPIEPNHSAPLRTMLGTEAMLSTLLITVGAAYRPATAGNGGRSRGWAGPAPGGAR